MMMEYKAYLAALQPFSGEIDISYDEPMSRHTTFRIGGPADVFLRPYSAAGLGAAVRAAREHAVPYIVMGNGSNLLVHDEGYRGAVICTEELREIHVNGTCITAGAGALLSQIARAALDASLTGLEFAAGIPGSLGGAIFMNAGAYCGQMAEVLEETTYFDACGTRLTLPAAAHAFGYRTSVFQARQECSIAAARLMLRKGDAGEIRAKMDDFAARRREKQPLELPSAGSTFRRPAGCFAGKLIEDAGLRGLTIGGAQISEKHAGFVVNLGGATCADVLLLIETAQNRVREQFGVSLECEIRLV